MYTKAIILSLFIFIFSCSETNTPSDAECKVGESQKCYTGEESTKNIGLCKEGSQVCNEAGKWGACESEVLPIAEVCDGLDNSCNGVIDDELTAPVADKLGGVCTNSKKVCDGVNAWVEPDYTQIAHYEETEVSCDGKDNDCDGDIDEDLIAPYGNQKGVCLNSKQRCDGINGWVEPDYFNYSEHYERNETTCDGNDNDCDGNIDNNLTPASADKIIGVCANSKKVCGDRAWEEPDYTQITGYEVDETLCDGLDNDCDGTVDEGCDCNVGETRECGVCAVKGIQHCEAGLWKEECEGEVLPTEEVCDGLDNNCDGEIDENLTQLISNQEGVCLNVVETCNNGNWENPNYPNSYESSELSCDGLDNDCDGQVDEDLNAPNADNLNGICANNKKVCNGNNGWQEPDHTSTTGYDVEASTDTCDDLDNDCDGVSDEHIKCQTLTSCKDFLDQDPTLLNHDGIYTIDPDGEGGTEAFNVYCDMTTDGGGWTMVYKKSSGVSSNSPANDFISGNLNTGDDTLLNKNLSSSDYSNSIITQHWDHFTEARVEIRKKPSQNNNNTELKKFMHYNTAMTTKTEWYAKDYLIDSSWTDIIPEAYNYWSIEGDSNIGRNFFINNMYGGCENDKGWVFVGSNVNEICSWREPNKIKYAKYLDERMGPWSWNTDYIETADTFVIMVREASSKVVLNADGSMVGNRYKDLSESNHEFYEDEDVSVTANKEFIFNDAAYMGLKPSGDWRFSKNNFTVEFSFYLNNLNNIDNGFFGREDFQWLALEYNSGNNKKLNLWVDSDHNNNWEISPAQGTKVDWQTNTWYHIKVIRSGATIKVYVDGVEDINISYSGLISNSYSNGIYDAADLFIGRSQLSNRTHNGLMKNFKITKNTP